MEPKCFEIFTLIPPIYILFFAVLSLWQEISSKLRHWFSSGDVKLWFVSGVGLLPATCGSDSFPTLDLFLSYSLSDSVTPNGPIGL
ncbi:hypothetical protein ACSBR2_005887 [Camellia fascicularis]